MTSSPAAPVAVRGRRKRASTSISALEASAQRDTDHDIHREPVTDDALAHHWSAYIASNPDKMLLVEAMRSSHPQRVDTEEYVFVVQNVSQIAAYEQHKNHLLEYLRKHLVNDFLNIIPKIDDSVEVVKRMTNSDLFRDVVEKNEVIASFMKKIDPELI